MIVLGVLTDGRAELLERTIKSSEHLGHFEYRYIVNDSGDISYQAWLRQQYPDWSHVFHQERRGLAGAVQSVWKHALTAGCDYLFHLEGDWEILGPVDIEHMVGLLKTHRHLSQVVLQREPLSPSEIEAGGVAAHKHWIQRAGWVEEQEIFSLNPCVIPRDVLELGWPAGNERGFTDALPAWYWSAFLGAKDSPPHVHHLGTYRTPGWML